MKSLPDDSLFICDEIIDTLETGSINFIDKISIRN